MQMENPDSSDQRKPSSSFIVDNNLDTKKKSCSSATLSRTHSQGHIISPETINRFKKFRQKKDELAKAQEENSTRKLVNPIRATAPDSSNSNPQDFQDTSSYFIGEDTISSPKAIDSLLLSFWRHREVSESFALQLS